MNFVPLSIRLICWSMEIRSGSSTAPVNEQSRLLASEMWPKTMGKRVCLIRHGYYPGDMLFHREAKALRDYGFEVEVLCLADKGQPFQETVNGVQVYRLPLQRVKKGIGHYLLQYFSFFTLTALVITILHLRRRYAFIQVNTMPDFLVFTTFIPRLLGTKIMLHMYEPTPELWATRLGITQKTDLKQASLGQHLIVKLLQWIEQVSLRYCHAAFTVTQQLKDTLTARGADPNKTTVILNVPDPDLFEVDPEETLQYHQSETSNHHFTLICHGAIEERYGHDTMLQAIDIVQADIPEVQLLITGFGSYLDQFLDQIESMGLQDHVNFLGYVPVAQLVAELRRADIGIVAQKDSLYSNLIHTGKMYDFLTFEKPVIASRLRAIEAYFDDQSLCYFTPGDPEDLARAILDLYYHPQRRETLVQNAKGLYEHYKWEMQREKYWAAYAKLASVSHRSPITKVG